MIPKIGCSVSNRSQLEPVKTKIPRKTNIIKQQAAVYIQQEAKAELVCDCLRHNNKRWESFS